VTPLRARQTARTGRAALLSVVFLAAVALWPPGAAAAPSATAFPPFSAPVVDAARVVPDGVERSVSAGLADYQRRSGRQVAVAVVATTGNRSLEDYSIDLARDWGVGTKGRDNGVLLLVATRDRRVRIEVGRGLEGVLTDLESGRIVQERLVPLLAAGRYGAAVEQGTDAIRSALGDRQVGILPAPPEPVAATSTAGGFSLFVPILLVGLFIASLFGRRRRRRRWGGVGVPIIWGGGLGGGLGGGGGFGGGGGGGFGGGGGGGFGGGGASGGW
jgi:uncharacterized protein